MVCRPYLPGITWVEVRGGDSFRPCPLDFHSRNQQRAIQTLQAHPARHRM